MPNLMKDNVVPANTFPLIINWEFAFLLLYLMLIPCMLIMLILC